MKKPQVPIVSAGVRDRLAGFRDCAVDMASQAGLHAVDARFADVVAPQLRCIAWDLFGPLTVQPEVLEGREIEFRKRAVEASSRAAALFATMTAAPLTRNQIHPMLGWRGCLIIVLTAILLGVLRPATDLRDCAMLAILAAIAVLALPLVPIAAKLLLCVGFTGATYVCDVVLAAIAHSRCHQLRRSRWSAEDHRARVDQWVSDQLSYLVAEYEYHKGLAAAARLAV